MLGGDLSTPIVHQDLINSSMGPMYMPFGGVTGYGIGTSPYLGGVRMQRQLDQDKLDLMNKKETEDKGTLKKALIALAVIIGLGSIAPLRKSIKKAGGISAYLKNQWTNIVNSIKGNKASNSSNNSQTKVSFWQKLKNIFKGKKIKP